MVSAQRQLTFADVTHTSLLDVAFGRHMRRRDEYIPTFRDRNATEPAIELINVAEPHQTYQSEPRSGPRPRDPASPATPEHASHARTEPEFAVAGS